MAITTIFLFLFILAIIGGSLTLVICLIIKASGQNKKVYQNSHSVPMDDTCSQSVTEHTVGSPDRISEMDMEYLKKIKSLKDNDVLSEEEYITERDKIINN